MKNCYIGIDVGGTAVKAGAVDVEGNTIIEGSVSTGVEGGADNVAKNIASLVNDIKAKVLSLGYNAVAAGMGCPGTIDSENGVVVFAGNLKFKNVPLAKDVERITGLKVKITNDANAAALGEAKFGAGKNYSDSVMITLGTGVGGGIVIGGKLFEGYRSAGAEIGHTVIVKDGLPCTCGRRGCFEAYSSATALIKRTKKAMEENPSSLMWTKYTLDTVDGRTAFSFADEDEAAKEVVTWYEENLACGITNMANIFRPQAVLIGGGISGQGENLLSPVRKIVEKEIFGGNEYAPVRIECATLGNRAGFLGAAALVMDLK